VRGVSEQELDRQIHSARDAKAVLPPELRAGEVDIPPGQWRPMEDDLSGGGLVLAGGFLLSDLWLPHGTVCPTSGGWHETRRHDEQNRTQHRETSAIQAKSSGDGHSAGLRQ
jgi:hypothetical protein